MPASGKGDVRPAKMETEPPWEKPPEVLCFSSFRGLA